MTGQASLQQGAAIILAGGKSTRLGRDKAGEVVLGRPLLQHVIARFEGVANEFVIVQAADQQLPPIEPPADTTIVVDLYPEMGPLAGILTGLTSARAAYGVVVACDMPLLRPALLSELMRLGPFYDLVVPLKADGLPEPLCAAYSKRCLEPIRRQIEAGEYKVSAFFDKVVPHYLQPEAWRHFDPEGLSFQNLNEAADLQRIEAIMRREAA